MLISKHTDKIGYVAPPLCHGIRVGDEVVRLKCSTHKHGVGMPMCAPWSLDPKPAHGMMSSTSFLVSPFS
jgi:hypothetical protein